MEISSVQLDQLATILENKSGDTRYLEEGSYERIITSLETLAKTGPVTNMDFAKRLIRAVSNLDFSGGGNNNGGSETVDILFDGDSLGFALARSFNGNVNIAPEITVYDAMFYDASIFNQPVTISDSAVSLSSCFAYSGYNQPVTIPNTVQSVYMMFSGSSFNSTVNIADGVEDISTMFQNADAFNQPVTIPESVTNCSTLFDGAKSFSQDIVFPVNCNDATRAFANSNFGANAYFLNPNFSSQGIFANCNNSVVKTAYFVNSSYNHEKITIPVTSSGWEAVDNGYYHSALNIYVLFNVPEELYNSSPSTM